MAVLAVVLALASFSILCAAMCAPVGFQDETGFHFGVPADAGAADPARE